MTLFRSKCTIRGVAHLNEYSHKDPEHLIVFFQPHDRVKELLLLPIYFTCEHKKGVNLLIELCKTLDVEEVFEENNQESPTMWNTYIQNQTVGVEYKSRCEVVGFY